MVGSPRDPRHGIAGRAPARASSRPKRTCIVSNVKLISQCEWSLLRACWSRGGTFPVNFAEGVTAANSRGTRRSRGEEVLRHEVPPRVTPAVGDRPRFHYDRGIGGRGVFLLPPTR